MAIAELSTICWIYGTKRLCRDIEFMLGIKTSWYWRMCWTIVAPGIMIIVLIYQLFTMEPLKYNGKDYPTRYAGKFTLEILWRTDIFTKYLCFIVAGWCLSIIGLIQIPLWIVLGVCRQRGESLKDVNEFEANIIFVFNKINFCKYRKSTEPLRQSAIGAQWTVSYLNSTESL